MLEEVEDRLPARPHDAIDPERGELGVALELAEKARQQRPDPRVGELARLVLEVLEQELVRVALAVGVELRAELAQRVGDQLLLRVPPPVDRVLADSGAGRDGVHRRRLEAPLAEQRQRRLDDRATSCFPARPTARAAGGLDVRAHLRNLSGSE